MLKNVSLEKFDNGKYPHGNILARVLWLFISAACFELPLPLPYLFKTSILRILGASIGKKTVIKPSVRIKYPWFLTAGDNAWIGEGAWIDNIGKVTIGNNVCISQGAYITTGNHDYKKEAFNLIVKDVNIEDGVWVGAKAIVCPGVTLKTHSVITAGSVITNDAEPYTVYQGNPARPIRKRIIE